MKPQLEMKKQIANEANKTSSLCLKENVQKTTTIAPIPKVLNDGQNKREIEKIMATAPVNSSGDIYHILSFIILAIKHNLEIPRILLAYDTGTKDVGTKMQVERSRNFAVCLGYGEHFEESLNLQTTGQRQNARQSSLVEHFRQRSLDANVVIQYFDQKLSTNIISHFFIEDRKSAAESLRLGYAKRDPKTVSETAQTALHAYANHWLEKIKSAATQNQPIIILHIRHSSDANANQNLPDDFIPKFKNYLEKAGFKVWFILADDRKAGSFSGIDSQRISPFADPLKKHYKGKEKAKELKKLQEIDEILKKENADVDFSKLKHLELLMKLWELPILKGVIGNTSGTLDLASFLGHNVYNVHNFTQGKIAYQDYRILIQMSFSSVEYFNNDKYEAFKKRNDKNLKNAKLDEADLDNIFENFSKWMAGVSDLNPAFIFKNPSYTNEGFWELLYCKEFQNGRDELVSSNFSEAIQQFVCSRFVKKDPLTLAAPKSNLAFAKPLLPQFKLHTQTQNAAPENGKLPAQEFKKSLEPQKLEAKNITQDIKNNPKTKTVTVKLKLPSQEPKSEFNIDSYKPEPCKTEESSKSRQGAKQ